MRKFFKSKSAPKKVETNLLIESDKINIRKTAYLGKKGYTIVKSSLSKEEYEFLKKDLFMTPVAFGTPAFGDAQESAFPIYRENTNKIYIPRFYGIERYGYPESSEIDQGMNIDVPFVKELRDYQTNVVNIYIESVSNPILGDNSHSTNAHNGGGGIIQLPCGRGKCLGKDTQILMYDGTIKLVQDIVIGDKIMGDDSMPRNVLSLARGREVMYKVHEKKGNGYIVNESHILSLKYSSTVNKNTPKGTVLDISVTDYLDLPKSYHGRGGVLVGYRVPILFPEVAVDFDPYILGYWLGDGSSRGAKITTQEASVIKYFVDYFKNHNVGLYFKYTGYQYDYTINTYSKNHVNSFMSFLRKNNLILNKHIPHNYKCNSRKIQLAILAGLIDSDGYCHCNMYEIVQKNEKLLDDIVFLAKSLGFAANKRKIYKTCTNAKGGPKKGVYFITSICGSGLEELPILCKRKICSERKQIKNALNYRIKLEKLEIDDYYGFEIDGNHRFVLGDFTVTHNTVIALKIISEIKKKTLIIVHKEFLMNQWIERIQEFLPSAKIGKIQAAICDVEGKDIVIGMVQTLYSRDYPQELYAQFGLTIVDEVHRISSEQFSKTLFRTITPFMLGISATVKRKDGLEKVLYSFIGKMIYTEERDASEIVTVRAIQYISKDSEFNEVEQDYRGNTKYSTMISKLCAYCPRSDFAIRVLADLVAEQPTSQIMILAHNRSLLTYLYDEIVARNIATVGYYVGGMKEAALKDTESKQIVVATYSMAAEALDIKTLSTLVMVTPKTDIVQSVGRILRMKHENPIIVDIIDSHDVFKNQWRQRKAFYRKSNYRIYTVDSPDYTNMTTSFTDKPCKWKKAFEPKVGNGKNKEVADDEDNDSGGIGKCMINTSMFGK